MRVFGAWRTTRIQVMLKSSARSRKLLLTLKSLEKSMIRGQCQSLAFTAVLCTVLTPYGLHDHGSLGNISWYVP